ncbi:putative Cytochrome P450 [Seiridium unicorne]|uniref:Cytochrome P450 n=1 Tax=Seiridium unicorne TaxID=138068 RepID=A0ABR2ULH6_9PEZI
MSRAGWKDADELRRERCLVPTESGDNDGEPTSRLKAMPAWTYLPLGRGPRICLGKHFALVESQYTIVRMMQTLQRIEKRDERTHAKEAGIPITMKYGAFVGLYRNENDSNIGDYNLVVA